MVEREWASPVALEQYLDAEDCWLGHRDDPPPADAPDTARRPPYRADAHPGDRKTAPLCLSRTAHVSAAPAYVDPGWT